MDVPRFRIVQASPIGFYVMVAMTLNAFAVPIPGGKERLA
jgi:hypothetical protein